MSLTFDADKDKNISMLVETSGIDDKENLNFTFNIIVDNVRYGFPCMLEGDKVKINIPALSGIINGVKTGKYSASLDVTGDSKCFLQPFKEEVSIVKTPKMNIVKNMAELGASITKIIDEDVINKEVEKKEVKKVVTETNRKIGKVDKIFT
jgi:hypothetical protein